MGERLEDRRGRLCCVRRGLHRNVFHLWVVLEIPDCGISVEQVAGLILFCTTTLAVLFASQGLLTHHLSHFYTLAILMGLFTPGTSGLTYAKVVSNWFDRRRGMALSVLACGTGAAGIVVPPYAQHLIAHLGWRNAYFLLDLTAFLFGLVPVAIVSKDSLPTTFGAERGATTTDPGLQPRQSHQSSAILRFGS
jgi:MFS family permease